MTGNINLRIISIHPNPAVNVLAVETETPASQNIDVMIYDDLGRACFAEKHALYGKMTLDLPIRSLPAGTYHLTLKSATGAVSSEFIKLR